MFIYVVDTICLLSKVGLLFYFTNIMTLIKIFGIITNSDFLVTYMLQKVAKQMDCIICLVHAGVPVYDILCFYCSIIRSILNMHVLFGILV